MRKRLRVRGTFAPGAVLLQGRAACRSTRVGCEGGNLGSWCLLGSHRAVRRSGGAPTGGASRFGFVGAPVAGAIWGGAFGRAGHAVRTGGGAPTGDDPWVVGAPAPGAKGSASLIILARVFRWPPSLLHPTPPRLSFFLFSR